MAYRGRYKPKNREKYIGDPDNVIFRSLWERTVMEYLDNNKNVVKWSSEEIIVWYISPIDGRKHRYFPDFWVCVKTPDGSLETQLIEVKPYKQTFPPKEQKRRTKRYLREVATWQVNKAKWIAAIKYCSENGWKFKIITEKNLKPGNK